MQPKYEPNREERDRHKQEVKWPDRRALFPATLKTLAKEKAFSNRGEVPVIAHANSNIKCKAEIPDRMHYLNDATRNQGHLEIFVKLFEGPFMATAKNKAKKTKHGPTKTHSGMAALDRHSRHAFSKSRN